MATNLMGTNMSVSVENAVGSSKAISSITLANPGVVTCTASHGLSTGAVVRLTMTAGMPELDGQVVRIASATGTDFTLEGLDTSAYTAFTSGSAAAISSWSTLTGAQNITMPNPSPAKADATTLVDTVKQYEYGLPDAPDGTITGIYRPGDTAVAKIAANTKSRTATAFKVAWSGGQYHYFNANVSGGQGFDLAQNQIATATINFTPVKDVMYYAS